MGDTIYVAQQMLDAKAVKRRAKALGLSLAAVARKLGVSRSLLDYHLSSGSPYYAPLLARALKCDAASLLKRRPKRMIPRYIFRVYKHPARWMRPVTKKDKPASEATADIANETGRGEDAK